MTRSRRAGCCRRRPQGAAQRPRARRGRRARRLGGADQLRHRGARRLPAARRRQVVRDAAGDRFRRGHGLRHGAGGAPDAPDRAAAGLHRRHADLDARRVSRRRARWRSRLSCCFAPAPSSSALPPPSCSSSASPPPTRRARRSARAPSRWCSPAASSPRCIGPQTVIHTADLFATAPFAGAFLGSAALTLSRRSS